MPEIKNNFTGAKMNQDLDERLIPKGEYREGFNIDVSSSEEDNVGAIQNSFGNVVKSNISIAGSKCIGSYVNKEDNTIIWFIKGDTVDAIVKYNPNTDETTPLLVDKEEVNVDRFLKFNTKYLITGINVVDDLLFWTDNLNEPRKLNINRHYSPDFTSTTLFKDGINLQATKKFTEHDITVIKKYPLDAPTLSLFRNIREGNVEGKAHTQKNTHKVSSTQRSGFEVTNSTNIFGRGSGSHSHNKNITEQTYLERAVLTTVVEKSNDVICFDPSETAVIGKQSSYMRWQAVRTGMRVRISTHASSWVEPTESFTIKNVDYLNHRITLNAQIGTNSLISANRLIRISEWSEPFNNENFWQYKDSTNKIINKPNGVNSGMFTDTEGANLLDGGLLNNGTGTDIILAISGDTDSKWTKGGDAGTYTSTNDTGSKVYLEQITPASSGLIDGHIYKISVSINRTGGSGKIGFSHDDAAGAATGIGYEVVGAYTGTKTFNYIFKSKGKRLKIFADANTTGVIIISSITCLSGPRAVTIEPISFFGDVSYKQGDIVRLSKDIGSYGQEQDTEITIRLKLLEEITGHSNILSLPKSQVKAVGDGVVGNDKVQNGDFSSTAGWTSFGGSSGTSSGTAITTSATDAAFFVTSGALTSPNSEWGYAENTLSEALVDGEVYKMTYSVTTAATGNGTDKGVLKLLLGTFVDGQSHCPDEVFLDTYTTGTKTVYWKQRAVSDGAISLIKIKLYNDTRWNGVIDDIVIKKATNTAYTVGGVYGSTPTGGRKTFDVQIINNDKKVGTIVDADNTSWTSLREQEDPIYELEMPRFAYRWKYLDNEYSSFSPFTEVAFLPEDFFGYEYNSEDGYNKAMFNDLRRIKISGFKNKPKDVIELELLVKNSGSNAIYVTKKFKKENLNSLYKGGSIEITKKEIKSLLPANQILRSYDNVPRRAKSQEITANRLIYGNYIQQYNISDTPLDFNISVKTEEVLDNKPKKSIKSIRDYEVGISYLDQYGRQTPVFSDESGVVNLTQQSAESANSFAVSVSSKAPDWATHYKYWIKDSASEYYNIAMDRFYNAEEEENVWISFPSSETNKVSIGDYIVLKKAHAQNVSAKTDFTSTLKYKVLDKESNAPDYIKYKKEEIGVSNNTTTFSYGPQVTDSANTAALRNAIYLKQGGNYPSKGYTKFSISAKDLTEDTDLLDLFETSCENSGKWYDFENKYVRFKTLQDGTATKHYETTRIYKKLFLNRQAAGTGISEDDGFKTTTVSAVASGGQITVSSGSGIKVGMAICTGSKTSNTAFGEKVTVKVVGGNTLVPSQKLMRLQTGQEIHFKDIHEAFIFEVKEPFTNDVGFLGESPVSVIRDLEDNSGFTESSTVIPNPQDGKFVCEFSKETQEGYGEEFKGKFFLKIKRDDVLNFNVAKTIASTNSWKSKDSSSVSWAHSWLNDNASGNHANVLNYTDETDANYHGAGSILEDLIGITFPISSETTLEKFPTHGATFMIHGNLKINNFMTNGVRIMGTTEGFKEGVLDTHDKENYWINGYNGANTDGVSYNPSLCIDSSLSWNNLSYEIPGIKNDASTSTVDFNSVRRGQGFVVGSTMCSFKFFGIEKSEPTIEYLGDKYNIYTHLTKRGTQFRIQGDPTKTVYTVVNVRSVGSVFNNHAGAIGYTAESTNGSGKWTDNYGSGDSLTWKNRQLFDGTNLSQAFQFISMGYEQYYNQGIVVDLQLNKAIQWSPTDPSTSFDGGKAAITPLGLTCANATFGTATGSITSADTKANTLNHGNTNSCVISICHLDTGDDTFTTKNPAVFEVLPKERADLNLFYETPTTSIILKDGMFIKLANKDPLEDSVFRATATISVQDNIINNQFQVNPSQMYKDCTVGTEVEVGVKDANGDIIYSQVFKLQERINGADGQETNVNVDTGLLFASTGVAASGTYNLPYVVLDWHNCFSFGNGVESNRIFDDFNATFMDKGPVVSTILEQTYEEDHRKYSMIYSGIYNETSGVNRLNQFIQAEKITKDLNPDYGSIQKLFTRNTNIVVLCEDKTLKVLANKDALFNADGNPQLTATNKVLGQTIPFAGEYGISKNPESFACYGYRVYYSDMKRNAVLRLSGDGITNISSKGMSTFFRDNLSDSTTVIGGYDESKDLYNITLNSKTVSFTEKVNGWTSLKSFIPDNSVSVSGNYYSFSQTLGATVADQDNKCEIWLHNKNLTRGSFYGREYDSSVKFIFNDAPGSIKSFKSINYEGTTGWKAPVITTDNESGSIDAFVNKEGKYFNFIQGDDHDTDNLKLDLFTMQGIGQPASVNISSYAKYFTHTVTAVDIASNVAPKKWNLNNSATDTLATNTTISFNDDNGVMAQTKTAVFYVHPQIVNGIQWAISSSDFTVSITNTSSITASASVVQFGTKIKITVSYSGTFPNNNSNSTITISSGSAYQTQQ